MKPKYGNKKTAGFDSKAEAKRGMELGLMERMGHISDLKRQVRFQLIPPQDGERPVSYVADFEYIDVHGNRVVEDVKGVRTDAYIIKRKLMLQVFGIKIREVA